LGEEKLAKTFEALMKAEKEHRIRPEDTKVFNIRPQAQFHIPKHYNISPQVAEEYHRMKHLILSTHPGRNIKTILFSSAKEGEGTTTVTRDFAITLTSAGDTVLLVDANLRKPVLHNVFNLEKKIGLTELLTGMTHLNDTIKQTAVKNLYVITSGIQSSNASSLFYSKLLDSLLEQMKQQVDWVLFDASPIHSYNDASILAAKMEGVIMVLQAESTRWEVAQSAKERIETEKVKLLGAVLNRRKMYIPEWVYRML
jgi:capsular exopolysaccharide synthesis family protein